MRILNAAVGAVLLILVASPTLAGDRRGGGHPGGGESCGGRCGGGGGHQPPPHTPPPPHGGGYNSNINVNVNANTFAGASAGSYLNARTYDVGSIRGGGYGGGTVYVGGGYGGGGDGYHGGGPVYIEEVHEGPTCASAPFGYVVSGFGRTGRRAPACVATSVCRDGDDRGGRYGYSERRGCVGGGGRQDDSHARGYSRAYESHVSGVSYGGRCGGSCGGAPDAGIGDYERGYIDGRSSCGGCAPRGHDDDHGGDDYVPYPPPYQPEPPRYEPPAPPARPYRPERPRPSQPPRQHYSQEPGERG